MCLAGSVPLSSPVGGRGWLAHGGMGGNGAEGISSPPGRSLLSALVRQTPYRLSGTDTRRCRLIQQITSERAMADLWSLERRLWTEGVDAYERLLATACTMVFCPTGIMHRDAIIESMKLAPRWSDVGFSSETETAHGQG